MTKLAWIGLKTGNRALVLDGLAALRRSRPADARHIDRLIVKLVQAVTHPYPDITIGVHGG